MYLTHLVEFDSKLGLRSYYSTECPQPSTHAAGMYRPYLGTAMGPTATPGEATLTLTLG